MQTKARIISPELINLQHVVMIEATTEEMTEIGEMIEAMTGGTTGEDMTEIGEQIIEDLMTEEIMIVVMIEEMTEGAMIEEMIEILLTEIEIIDQWKKMTGGEPLNLLLKNMKNPNQW